MGGGSDLQHLTAWQNLLLGMTAGAGSKMVNYPLLVIKNSIQQGKGMPDLRPHKLYRGLPVAVVNMGGTTMVQFSLTGGFQKAIRKHVSQNDTVVQMGGAILGGLGSGIPCALWELVMVQQQNFGGTLFGTPLRIFQKYGAGGILRGMPMTLGREALFTLAMLGITPWIQTQLHGDFGLESNTALAAGALVGSLTAATLSHPMDTIKTCQQGDVAQVRFGSVLQTFTLLRAEHGLVKGLFKGLTWRIGLISTTFFLVNKIKQRLAPLMFPEALTPM